MDTTALRKPGMSVSLFVCAWQCMMRLYLAVYKCMYISVSWEDFLLTTNCLLTEKLYSFLIYFPVYITPHSSFLITSWFSYFPPAICWFSDSLLSIPSSTLFLYWTMSCSLLFHSYSLLSYLLCLSLVLHYCFFLPPFSCPPFESLILSLATLTTFISSVSRISPYFSFTSVLQLCVIHFLFSSALPFLLVLYSSSLVISRFIISPLFHLLIVHFLWSCFLPSHHLCQSVTSSRFL